MIRAMKEGELDSAHMLEFSEPEAAVPEFSPPLRVMIIDMSLGFGGATKSASLILEAMPGIVAHVVTSQDLDVCNTWYSDLPITRWRTLLNYRTRSRVAEWLSRRLNVKSPRVLTGRVFGIIERIVFPWHVFKLLRLAARTKTDLIHLQNGFGPLEAFAVGRLLRIPVVVHMRGMWGKDSGSRTLGARVCVVGDSQAVVDSLPSDILPEATRTTIHEPVNIDAFESTAHLRQAARDELGLHATDIGVGIFGRVIPWKGQREFVNAFLEAAGSHPRLRGFVIGSPSDGGPSYLEELVELVAASEHRTRVTFVGYTPAVEQYFHAMDIIVHASTEPEPCGMVVLEGMAAGKPVIAAEAGGPIEIVSHGYDGILVSPGNVPGLRQAILQLANDDQLRREMGRKGREKARREYSVPRASKQVVGVYSRILDLSL